MDEKEHLGKAGARKRGGGGWSVSRSAYVGGSVSFVCQCLFVLAVTCWEEEAAFHFLTAVYLQYSCGENNRKLPT